MRCPFRSPIAPTENIIFDSLEHFKEKNVSLIPCGITYIAGFLRIGYLVTFSFTYSVSTIATGKLERNRFSIQL